MANYPLPGAMLGEVLARAGAEYAANQQRRQTREEQLADVAAARAFQQEQLREEREYRKGETAEERAFQTTWRQQGWDRDTQQYNDRFYDDMKKQLVAADLLTLQEAKDNNQTAFQRALKAGSPETQRNREELAKFRATIDTLRDQAKGNKKLIARLNEAYDLKPDKPDDIDKLREIRKEANDVIGKVVAKKWADDELNDEHAAILLNQYQAEMSGIRNQARTNAEKIARIERGELTDDEWKDFENTAMTKLSDKSRKEYLDKKPGRDAKIELANLTAKVAAEYKQNAPYALVQQSRDLNAQLATVAGLHNDIVKAADKGYARRLNVPGVKAAAEGLMDPAKSMGTGKLTPEQAQRDYLDQKKGAKPGAAGATFAGPVAGLTPQGLPAAETLRFPTAAAPIAPDIQARAAMDQAAPAEREFLTAPPAAAPAAPWSPPVVNPAAEMIERSPTGGVYRTAADVQRRRNSDVLGNAIVSLVGPAAGRGMEVDPDTGRLATPGQQAMGFGLNRTATDSIWDRIRGLTHDPRGPLRIDLLKEGMMLAKARGESIPDDIAQEFFIPSGQVPAWSTIPSDVAGAAQRIVPLGNIGSAPRAFGVEPTTSLAPAKAISELTARAREDDVVTRTPWSAEAIMIRNRRGLPPPSAVPAPVTFGSF